MSLSLREQLRLKQRGLSDEAIAAIENQLSHLAKQAEGMEHKEMNIFSDGDYGIDDLILGGGDVVKGRQIQHQQAKRLNADFQRRLQGTRFETVQPVTTKEQYKPGTLAAIRQSIDALAGR